MPTYRVTLSEPVLTTLFVDARDETAAGEEALRLYESGLYDEDDVTYPLSPEVESVEEV